MKKVRKRSVALASLLLMGAALLSTFAACPLPAAAPFAGALPVASAPPAMALVQLPTGVTHRSAAFAYRGGSFGDARDFVMTAALVKHPRGDVLIDTGFGRDVDAHLSTMPLPLRAVTTYTRGRSVGEQMDAAHYDRKALRAVLLTHAHWDHVSGLPELVGTPVWVTAEERRFVREGGELAALARSFADVSYEVYAFEGGEYLGFPRSHDVYGDGAIVVVPAPGHTPGSVIVFVTLPDAKRYAFVGDLAWQREGIALREERPWIVRSLADSEPRAVRDALLRMSALATRFPELTLVPAHDARGFAGMPTL